MTTWCLFPNLLCYFLASLCYLILTFRQSRPLPWIRFGFTLTLFGLLLHSIYLGFLILQKQFSPLAMVALAVVGLFVGLVWRKSWHGLGTIFVPLGFISLLLSLGSTTKSHLLGNPSGLVLLHILLAGAAFLLMCGSLGFGLAFFIQERSLKQKHWGNLFWYLPPLLTNEHLAMIWLKIGFALLTLVLVTGAWLIIELSTTRWWHVGLALVAWVLYAFLLERRLLAAQAWKILLLSLLGFVSLGLALLWN